MRLALTAALLAAAVAWILVAAGAVPGGPVPPSPIPPGPAAQVDEQPPAGLRLTLSDADPAPAEESAAPTAVETLEDAASAALLGRAPALEPVAEPPPFAFPPSSRPAPRTGQVLSRPPLGPGTLAGTAPAAPDPEPLTLLRFTPEGEVPQTDHLALTFSQPMVPVGAVGDLADRVPVALEPALEGSWRWAGTRTLVFEARPRLPMATHLVVEVPAGTRSATGGVLARTLRLRCSTPAPRLVEALPRGESVPRRPLIALAFDQRVDPQRVAAHLRLLDEGWLGDDELPLRLASADEQAGDDERSAAVRELVERHGRDRVVVLVPEKALPYDTELVLRLPPGLASAEGARLSEADHAHRFTVHGPLELDERNGTSSRPLWSQDTLELVFSNPLDPSCLAGLSASVEPPLPETRLELGGSVLRLPGDWRGHDRRRVRIDGTLRDVFGQSLTLDELDVRVRPMEPALTLDGGDLQVLDPDLAPYLALGAVNVDSLTVAVARVEPGDWQAYRDLRQGEGSSAWLDERWSRRTTLSPEGGQDEPVALTLGLADLLENGRGHLLARVEGKGVDQGPRWAWLQRTGLGLHVAVDDGELLAWVTDLASGAPVQGAQVQLSEGVGAALSDAGGLARLALPDEAARAQVALARLGDDVTFVPESSWRWSWRDRSAWVARERESQRAWYVFDDRGTYKPGETLRVKGWVRQVVQAEGGGTERLPAGTERLRWLLRDARRNELASGETTLDRFGGFALEQVLPDDLNLGQAQLRLTLGDQDPVRRAEHVHRTLVAEYRLPEYAVAVSAEPGVAVLGDRAVFEATARYYTGGGLPDAPVAWTLRTRAAHWSAPGWSGFHFGPAGGWHRLGGELGGPWEHRAVTDAAGVHRLAVDLQGQDEPRAVTLTAEAGVTDVNRQRWASSASLLVHPAALAVGLDLQRGFVDPGQPVPLRLIVTDLQGAPVADRPVSLVAVRQRWVRGPDGWSEEPVERLERTVASGAEPVDIGLVLPTGGRWTVSARVADDQGREQVSGLSVWVSGAAGRGEERLTLQDVTLIPDRDGYAAGDVARVLVVAPFADGQGLLTLERSGLVHAERFTMQGTSQVLEVPIRADLAPALELAVELSGRAPRLGDDGAPRADGRTRVAFARGQLRLEVPPEHARLALDVRPAAAVLEPGSVTSLSVTVTGADGAPVADAQVAVAVVDEAVLALTGRELADPLTVLHPGRRDGVSEARSRTHLRLGDPDRPVPARFGDAGPDRALSEEQRDELAQASREAFELSERSGALRALGYLGGGSDAAPSAMPVASKALAARDGEDAFADDLDDGGAAAADPVRERARFDVLAAWRPAETTDAAGRVTLDLELPDNLTRYRILAVAVAGADRAGQGEAGLTARLPLMVRPSPPRFLNVGDRCDLPVVVQNGGEQELTVDVGLAVAGLVLEDQAARRLTIPAGERVELSWPVRAAVPGEARLSVVAAAVDGPAADAARVAFPVHTPATVEAFASYGQLVGDALAFQPVLRPVDVLPGFGGLELSSSTTALSELADALVYLGEGSFGCAEQRASRVLAAVALADALEAFDAVDPEDLAERVQQDLDHLATLQQGDGGFALWRSGRPSHPFTSVHVTHALLAAGRAGYLVAPPVLERALAYTANVAVHLRAVPYPPSERVQRTVRAYGLWVEDRAGRDVVDRALDLAGESPREELTLDARAWLLAVLAADDSAARAVTRLRDELDQRLVETASTAHLASSRQLTDGHLVYASARRSDALYLDALLVAGADDDLVTKLVRGLLGHRVAGRWATTQECVFALLALGRTFERFEADSPSLELGTWLDQRLVAEVDHRGRSVDTTRVELPLDLLPTDGPADLALASAGQGRLYYRIGLRYAPADALIPGTSQGFVVERSYEALEDPDDVRRDADGVWHLRAGASVRVRLSLVAGSDRHHVALVDRLPAGLEILNPGLAVTGSVPEDEVADPAPPDFWRCWWWGRPWYEHTNLRDDRAEAFASDLSAGVHHFSYVARATTPGAYLAPGTTAEEMYAPETFARAPTDRVVITP